MIEDRSQDSLLVEAFTSLADREARLRAFVDHSPAVAWMKDADGRYVYLSRQFERQLGAAAADWLGKTDFDLWPADVARQVRANDLEALDGEKVVEALEQAAGPGGEPRVWWVFKFPFADAFGRRYVGGVGVDVTERQRAKAALQRANDELRAALDKVRRLETLVTMCAWTGRVRAGGRWMTMEEFLRERGVQVTHGISDEALARMEGELRAAVGESSGP